MTPGASRSKPASAFRTISEAAGELGVAPHVLRFWESKFSNLRPMKRAGNRRYYRPADMAMLAQIKRLLYDEGYTIKGAQKALRAPANTVPTPSADTSPSLFDLPVESAERGVSSDHSPAADAETAVRLQEIAGAVDQMAAECAIVAAGNRPPTLTD